VNDSVADGLAARVATATPVGLRPLVALDHDGTLSPIAARPDEAVLTVGASAALRRLGGLAELAVVSGRGLDDLRRRFVDHRLTLVSEHGLRCAHPDGSVERLTAQLAAGTVDRVREQLETLLERHAGWLIEDKGAAVAVHYRLVPDADLQPHLDEVRRLLEEAACLAGDRVGPPAGTAHMPGGQVQVGKAVLELRPAGANKGSALRWLAERTIARPIVMVGDDATDEPALLAAEQLGGFGILVAETTRPTSASARLSGPAAVVRFLDRLAHHLEQRATSVS